MAKATKTRSGPAVTAESAPTAGVSMIQSLVRAALTTGSTGRSLMVFQRGAVRGAAKMLRDKAGIATVSAMESGPAAGADIMCERLGVAVVSMDREQFHRVSVAGDAGGVLTVVPEGIKYAAVLSGAFAPPQGLPESGYGQVPPGFGQPGFAPPPYGYPPYGYAPPPYGYPPYGYAPPPYGYPPYGYAPPPYPYGVMPSPFTVPQPVPVMPQQPVPAPFGDGPVGLAPPLLMMPQAGPAGVNESQATWGLQATNVLASNSTGNGVKVAVLDTGLDLNHPDFASRIGGQEDFTGSPNGVQDMFGHGTHCAGTVLGPRQPQSGPRYGVAFNAQLFVGKVLGDDGFAPDGA